MVFKAKDCGLTHLRVNVCKEEKRVKVLGPGNPQPLVVEKVKSNQSRDSEGDKGGGRRAKGKLCPRGQDK